MAADRGEIGNFKGSRYSVGRYDTFAVDKKLILVFSVGGVLFGLNAVFLAEIIQTGDVNYNDKGSKTKNILGSINIRDEKIPVFNIKGYFRLGNGDSDTDWKGEGGRGESLRQRGGGGKSVRRGGRGMESVNSMVIIKRGLGDSSELQRGGIIVDYIEGVLDERSFDRFPFPEIAVNESTKIYQELLMISGNMVLLLNIPWLMEMILPSD
ncbi:MAG: chemotaxis protein CheW [Deltaproteobacteria bacterium]|uniref:Chemotaxis protein CheW n=1 Tax=Candidatus Zymogenus saltonus TaxID=2844893 RepID=A0A9D8KKC0_9DELT|nr:chemotaxis protein CheW [Candidatus Zymogenus saltonus]